MPVRQAVLALCAAVALTRTGHAQKTAMPAKLVVGLSDFQWLRWVEGNWRGTSDSTTTRFERYHFVDDSTLVVEHYPNDRFSGATSREWYELRKNRVASRSNPEWIANLLDSASVTFHRPTRSANSLIWRKLSNDEWVIVLTSPPTLDFPAKITTWHMKRAG